MCILGKILKIPMSLPSNGKPRQPLIFWGYMMYSYEDKFCCRIPQSNITDKHNQAKLLGHVLCHDSLLRV